MAEDEHILVRGKSDCPMGVVVDQDSHRHVADIIVYPRGNLACIAADSNTI
jgi:hypothetical protein